MVFIKVMIKVTLLVVSLWIFKYLEQIGCIMDEKNSWCPKWILSKRTVGVMDEMDSWSVMDEKIQSQV